MPNIVTRLLVIYLHCGVMLDAGTDELQPLLTVESPSWSADEPTAHQTTTVLTVAATLKSKHYFTCVLNTFIMYYK